MRNDPQINDPVLTGYVDAVVRDECARCDVSVLSVLNGCKRHADSQARAAIVCRLANTMQMRECQRTDANATRIRHFRYRILKVDGAALHEQTGSFLPRSVWRPISTPKLAWLLRIDHSTVVYILKRADKR